VTVPSGATVAVLDFTINQRSPYANGREFGAVGEYEQIDGLLSFAVDPSAKENSKIVDLQLAQRADGGKVHFTADFSVVVPKDPHHGNSTAIVELPNRGRRRVVPVLNRAPASAPVSREAHPGDGFLFERGFTVASLGWQWDVYRTDAMMGFEAPLAHCNGQPVSGQTVVEIRSNELVKTWLLADRSHQPLPASLTSSASAVLYVRDYEDGDDRVIPSDRWEFARQIDDGQIVPSEEHVFAHDGFEPGKIYQVVYETDRAPVAGLALLALRDVAPLLRDGGASGALPGHETLIAWGISQTGRLLRHFVSLGLNVCEDGRMAYDGLQPHVGGARRGAFNHRFAQPSNQTTPLWGHAFPYADVRSHDPLTKQTAGLMDALEAANAVPKIISTNSAAEYWRGDATLAHVTPDATADLPEHPHTRSYLFASTQHVPALPGQSRVGAGLNTVSRYPLNVLDYRPLLRAALVNLHAWITQGGEPPASKHPRVSDGTAVTRDEVIRFYKTVPGFVPPDPQRLPFVRTVDMGVDEQVGVGMYPAREGAFYPALVSAVDDDGNEVAGIRLPDVSVPVASNAGWNPRDPITGSPDQIVPMNGLSLFFPANESLRHAAGDPRPALEERYADRDDYEDKIRVAAGALVNDGYLLSADTEIVVDSALARYDWAVNLAAN
jgi:hypothetical protein